MLYLSENGQYDHYCTPYLKNITVFFIFSVVNMYIIYYLCSVFKKSILQLLVVVVIIINV